MSMVKRYIDDFIDEVANETCKDWDDLMDLFNKLNAEGKVNTVEEFKEYAKEEM